MLSVTNKVVFTVAVGVGIGLCMAGNPLVGTGIIYIGYAFQGLPPAPNTPP